MSDAPKCPKCQRALMSRFSKLCSFCGAKLPEEILFSAEQKTAIESEEKKVQERLDAAEAERMAEQAARFAARSGIPNGSTFDEITKAKLKKWEDEGWPDKKA